MGKEVIGRLVHDHLAAGNVLVDFPLTPLPLFGPEPRLIGWHRQCRAQFDHPVTALEDLDLRSRVDSTDVVYGVDPLLNVAS